MELMSKLRDLLFGSAIGAPTHVLRKARALSSAIPLIAQSLVDNSARKIQIRRQHGPGGCTDGKTIWIMDGVLPRTEKDLDTFLQYAAIKAGLVHHEVGHVNETDFNVQRPVNDPLANNVLGIIEDIRQENAHIRKVPSARRYMDALSVAFIIQGFDGPVSDNDPSILVFTAYLQYRLRADFRKEQHFNELADQAQAVMEKRFTEGMVMRLDCLLDRVPDLQNTEDALVLSQLIADFVRDELEQAQQQQQAAKAAASSDHDGDASSAASGADDPAGDPGNAQGESDGSSSDDSSESTPEGGNGEASDEGGQDSGKDPATGDTDDSSQTAAGGDSNEAPASPGSSISDQVIQALQQLVDGEDSDRAKGDRDSAVRDALQQLSQTLLDNGADVQEVDLDAIRAADQEGLGPIRCGRDVPLDQASSLVGRLRAQLRRELQARSLVKTALSDRGHRLGRNAVHRLGLGDPRVFRSSRQGTTVDTSIVLLADVSSSMCWTGNGVYPIDIASQAMFATACALFPLKGVRVAAAAFPGRQVVLPFGTRPDREANRFCLHSFGGTPLHEGVLQAHRMLLKERNPRRILFVLTDGDPDCAATAVATIDAAREDGIETFGLGIGADCVKRLFDHWDVVHSLEEVPERMLAMLKGRLDLAA